MPMARNPSGTPPCPSVIFGSTGNLSQIKLLPARYRLGRGEARRVLREQFGARIDQDIRARLSARLNVIKANPHDDAANGLATETSGRVRLARGRPDHQTLGGRTRIHP